MLSPHTDQHRGLQILLFFSLFIFSFAFILYPLHLILYFVELWILDWTFIIILPFFPSFTFLSLLPHSSHKNKGSVALNRLCILWITCNPHSPPYAFNMTPKLLSSSSSYCNRFMAIIIHFVFHFPPKKPLHQKKCNVKRKICKI